MKHYWIFCQAPADIPHILKLYEDLIIDKNSKITIVLMNGIKVDAFSFMNLQISFKILPPISISFKKPWELLFIKKHTIYLLKNIGLWDDLSATVYFTSIYDDPSTAYYISLLAKHNKTISLHYLNHYDDNQNIKKCDKLTIRERMSEFLYKIFLSLPMSYCSMSNRWDVLRFSKEKYVMQEHHPLLDNTICKKYAYKTNSSNANTVLLFAGPNREKSLISDEEFIDLHLNIIRVLKEKGYNIAVKGHPRLGVPKVILDAVDMEIPQIISGEFIDLVDFKFCIGFVTIALSSAAKLDVIPSYSFLPLVSNKDNDSYNNYVSYVNQTSNHMIRFIYSMAEIVDNKANTNDLVYYS